MKTSEIIVWQKKKLADGFPFDNNTLVIKVLDKMFALANLDDQFSINLKSDTGKAIELRKKYLAVKLGYHMNKKHWNTVTPDESISSELIKQ